MAKRNPKQSFGGLTIERRGVNEGAWARLGNDAYHFLRGTSWPRLIGFFALVFLGLNLMFASILWASGAKIVNSDGSLWDCYAFSVETLATIGYGYLAPDDRVAHSIVTMESFVGIIYTAVVTGVFFGKFATPTAKVLFSETCLINDDEGAPTLLFRAANARVAAIVEATVRVAITRDELVPGGGRMRRIYDLALRRNTSPMFALSWTVFHKIDEQSPLYGRTEQQIRDEATTIICTLTGIDDSLASTVHTRHAWAADQIRWGERFVDIIGREPDGSRFIDYRHFHETQPAPVTRAS